MNIVKGKVLEGERALYGICDTRVEKCRFQNGESPFKECKNIEILDCEFSWKYPVWYSENIKIENTIWQEMARAGGWYNKDIKVKNCKITAPKAFRKSRGIEIENTCFTDAQETMWNCSRISLKDVEINGDYFAMNSRDIEADNLIVNGNYSFDGCRNIVIKNSKLLSKDAFWNCENVIVLNSYIEGEYLAWNSKNVKFIDCTIESLQGLCYVDKLVLENCKCNNTNLAFEYADVDAGINGDIISIFNPRSGHIRADGIGELILEEELIDIKKTNIECENIGIKKSKPDWK